MRNRYSAGQSGSTVLRICALIGLICVIAAGCGGQSPHAASGHHQAAGLGKHFRTSASGACTTAHLDAKLDLKSVGVAAGTSLVPLDFTNVTAASCRLAGYATAVFATSRSGSQVGAASTADRSLAAPTLLLGAGKTAHLWLRIAQTANLPVSKCRPETAAGLRVWLPGQVSPIFIAHKFMTCAKRIHGTDILTVGPFQAGRARSGTTQ